MPTKSIPEKGLILDYASINSIVKIPNNEIKIEAKGQLH